MQLAVPPQPESKADQRGHEILASVRQAFIEKGFDGASMQDLARAAGMSVGNFYRYFPSKAAIIHALIDRDHAELQDDFAAIIASPEPMQALRDQMRARIVAGPTACRSELWTEIEAAARRDADIAAATKSMEQAVRHALLSVIAADTGLTLAEAQARFHTAASFLIVLFKAASCLNCDQNPDQSELNEMIIRTFWPPSP